VAKLPPSPFLVALGFSSPKMQPPSPADYDAHKTRVQGVEQLYDDATVAMIGATLPCCALADADFAKTIRDWAVGYAVLRHAFSKHRESRSAAKAFSKELDNLAKKAKALKKALANLSPPARMILEANALQGAIPGFNEPVPMLPPNLGSIAFDIGRLATAAGETSEKRGKRGRPKHVARVIAVTALAGLYFECTGDRPKHGRDRIDGQRYGAFRHFVYEALAPIEGDDVEVGLDSLIGRLLYPQNS
jgi:hypothetical protein